MSEAILVALIGLLGTILGALIPELASRKTRRKKGGRGTWIGGLVGLLFGVALGFVFAQRSQESPFVGTWHLAFRFERNTANPSETPHPWLEFTCRLTQKDGRLTGLLESTGVHGELNGFSEGDELKGTMRLEWDNHDWESVSLKLQPGQRTMTGTAIFVILEDKETHHYSIRGTRLPSS